MGRTMRQRRAVAGGHICLDITPMIAGGKREYIEEYLKPGKLINVEGAKVHTGGSVGNTGLAMKLMGIDTKLMGKIGEDAFGKMLLSIISQYQAEDGMIVDSGATTSYSIVLAIPGIDRIFLHHAGANDTFSCSDIDFKQLDGVDLFHFGYPPIMKKMYQNNGEELKNLLQKVDQMGVVTSLDLAFVEESSDAGQQDWETILSRALPYIDFFVPSIEEIYYMLDREKYQECLEKSGKGDITENLSIKEDIEPLARKLVDMGANNILLKCGAPGLYYRTTGEHELKRIEDKLHQKMPGWANRTGFENSYLPKQILSASGAGDTTIAAFLASVLKGYTLEHSLQFATATGASCVASYDSLSGIVPLEKLRKIIDTGLEKQQLIRA